MLFYRDTIGSEQPNELIILSSYSIYRKPVVTKIVSTNNLIINITGNDVNGYDVELRNTKPFIIMGTAIGRGLFVL